MGRRKDWLEYARNGDPSEMPVKDLRKVVAVLRAERDRMETHLYINDTTIKALNEQIAALASCVGGAVQVLGGMKGFV